MKSQLLLLALEIIQKIVFALIDDGKLNNSNGKPQAEAKQPNQ